MVTPCCFHFVLIGIEGRMICSKGENKILQNEKTVNLLFVNEINKNSRTKQIYFVCLNILFLHGFVENHAVVFSNRLYEFFLLFLLSQSRSI